jgi:predicted aspartyl protease
MYADIKITGKKISKTIKRILIDTGASYTVLPKDILRQVGAFELPARFYLYLGNGKKVLASSYAVVISMRGVNAPCICVTFKGAQSVIGVETLESIGVRLDPVKRKLEFTRPKGVAYFLALN